MEGYMDFVLFALMNAQQLDWSGDFFIVTINNWIAIALLGLSFILPALTMLVYVLRNSSWED